jgi:hypothetical protein
MNTRKTGQRVAEMLHLGDDVIPSSSALVSPTAFRRTHFFGSQRLCDQARMCVMVGEDQQGINVPIGDQLPPRQLTNTCRRTGLSIVM